MCFQYFLIAVKTTYEECHIKFLKCLTYKHKQLEKKFLKIKNLKSIIISKW